MPLTDEEMVDRYGHEKSVYNTLADYAASQRTGLLPRMRERALEKNGLPSSEGLMHEPTTMAQKHYSNGDAYTDTMFGRDIFSYLENFCRARATGQGYAKAVAESLNNMDRCQIGGIVADMSLLENGIGLRDNYMSSLTEETDPAMIDRICLVDAEFALILAEKYLYKRELIDEGHVAAMDIADKDIKHAINSSRGVKALPQSIKDCPETELLEEFSIWLGKQRALGRVLEQSIGNQILAQGHDDELLRDALTTNRIYQDFCEITQQRVNEDLNNGLYVLQFAEAGINALVSDSPLNLGHDTLYQFVKSTVNAGMKNDTFISGRAQSFARAANHLMQELSREFPVISTVSEPPAKKISLEIT